MHWLCRRSVTVGEIKGGKKNFYSFQTCNRCDLSVKWINNASLWKSSVMSVVNLKSVIRNSVLKHPVLMSSLVWRKTPFCIINFVLLLDGACRCYFPTCWTRSAMCDWAFRPNSPLFHLLMREVKLVDQNWLEHYNKPGPYWSRRHSSNLLNQNGLWSWEWVIVSLIIVSDYLCAGSDLTWHWANIFQHSHNLPEFSVLSICLHPVIKRHQYCSEGRWAFVIE